MEDVAIPNCGGVGIQDYRFFDVNEFVHVNLRSDKDTGRARVLRLPEVSKLKAELGEASISFPDRYKVEYLNGEGQAHVRPARLQKIFTGTNLILVCEDTDEYRRLARSQLSDSDSVLEIGSSYGKCTEIIATHTKGKVIGVDISSDAVAAARKEFPHLRFEELNALENPQELQRMARAAGCSKVFVDIGGDREAGPVIRLLRAVCEWVAPRLLIVKSRNLHRALSAHVSSPQHDAAARSTASDAAAAADLVGGAMPHVASDEGGACGGELATAGLLPAGSGPWLALLDALADGTAAAPPGPARQNSRARKLARRAARAAAAAAEGAEAPSPSSPGRPSGGSD